MFRRWFLCVCVALLLIAQQGALTHAAWHASGGAPYAGEPLGHHGHAQDHENDSESPAGQASLCAFHLAFGQVLGGVHGACALPVSAEQPTVVSAYVFNPRLGTEAVPALSRGPPIFL